MTDHLPCIFYRADRKSAKMSLISPDNFQHILRVMNTNLEGKRNTMFAITAIKGVGRRFANIALKKVRKLVYNSVWAFVCDVFYSCDQVVARNRTNQTSSMWMANSEGVYKGGPKINWTRC